jgi:hypothetical protein
MPIHYEVQDVSRGELIARYDRKEAAIARADGLCTTDQFSGLIEVWEVDEDKVDGRSIPHVVYDCRG